MGQRNFLIVSLCDNDFGMNLEFAAKICIDEHGFDKDTESVDWRRQMIAGMLAYELIRRKSPVIDWQGLQRIGSYLHNQMKVFGSRRAPIEDHDGGSIYIDLHLMETYRY